MQPEIFELPEVNHGGIQTPFDPAVHSKLNSGKDPFKCGIQNAEWLNNKATKEQSYAGLVALFLVQKSSGRNEPVHN